MIRAIFACDPAGGIGLNNSMPWQHNHKDMLWFRDATLGHVVVMGSGTWFSDGMPRPLPSRTNVVFSRSTDKIFNGAQLAHGDVVEQLRAIEKQYPQLIIWVIGGADLLKQAQSTISEYYITRIVDEHDCDTLVDVDDMLNGFTCSHLEVVEDGTKFEIWKR